VEGAAIREIFNIKHIHHKPKNLGLMGGVNKKTRHRMSCYAERLNFGGRRW